MSTQQYPWQQPRTKSEQVRCIYCGHQQQVSGAPLAVVAVHCKRCMQLFPAEISRLK